MNKITFHCIGMTLLGLMALAPRCALALEYPYQTDEPQKSGWPLTEEEKQYVLKVEHERRPGREQNKHRPELWPVVPSAGFWGGTAWIFGTTWSTPMEERGSMLKSRLQKTV